MAAQVLTCRLQNQAGGVAATCRVKVRWGSRPKRGEKKKKKSFWNSCGKMFQARRTLKKILAHWASEYENILNRRNYYLPKIFPPQSV